MTCGQWSNISRWPCVILYTRYLKPGHLNVNLLNIAISCHSLHLQSLYHNPHYHQHQHQGDLMLGRSLNFFSDVNRDLLRYKECRFLFPFFDMFNTNPTKRLKLRNFSIDKGDGSENVTFKMNWRFFQLCRVYFNSLKIANVGQFPWSWFLWAHSSLERERKVCRRLFYVLHKTWN